MNSIPHNRILLLASLAVGVALLVSGCGTTSGYKQADKTGAGIADFREEIVNGKKAVDATMKSLSDVAASANTDPRKAFEQYSKNVANLEVQKSMDALVAEANTIAATITPAKAGKE